ncbi:hypothetical protein GCM10010271_62540 [Streptomyces kurssanovii]|nr:hypothetical protein GCM10010271_62540 [Streptomyces kurssanovii]
MVAEDPDEPLPGAAAEVGNLTDRRVGQDAIEQRLDLLIPDQSRADGHGPHVAMIEVVGSALREGHVRGDAEEFTAALDQPVEVAAGGVRLSEERARDHHLLVLDLDDLGPVQGAVHGADHGVGKALVAAVAEGRLAVLGDASRYNECLDDGRPDTSSTLHDLRFRQLSGLGAFSLREDTLDIGPVLEPAARGSLCGCPASLAHRKAAAQAGRGPTAEVRIGLRLADLPGLGVFSLVTDLVEVLRYELVEFTTRSGIAVSYRRPVVEVGRTRVLAQDAVRLAARRRSVVVGVVQVGPRILIGGAVSWGGAMVLLVPRRGCVVAEGTVLVRRARSRR